MQYSCRNILGILLLSKLSQSKLIIHSLLRQFALAISDLPLIYFAFYKFQLVEKCSAMILTGFEPGPLLLEAHGIVTADKGF